jgi:hypothetical protein
MKSNPIRGEFFLPILFDEAVALALPDTPEVPVVIRKLVTDPVPDPKVVAPAPVQVVTVALTVTTPPSYKLQVKTAPLTGVATPPGLFVNGSVPFLGIVAASKNWSLEPGSGEKVKLYWIDV